MAAATNPLRHQCEELVRLELARIGPAAIDRLAMVKAMVELGVSRSSAFKWSAAVMAEWEAGAPSVNPAEILTHIIPETVRAEAEAAGKALASLPSPAELRRLDAEAEMVAARESCVPDSPPPRQGDTPAAPAAPIAALPADGRRVLEQLQSVIETSRRVLDYAHGEGGKVRNPRMALAAAETLRRTLETALKVYDKADSVALVERFMKEMLDAVRPLVPELARQVVANMQDVVARWQVGD